MKISKIITSIAATGLMAVPVMAHAGTKASPLNLPLVRASTPVKNSNKIAGETALIGGLVLAAGVAVVVVATDDDKKSDGAQ
jgi:hypothetical protein